MPIALKLLATAAVVLTGIWVTGAVISLLGTYVGFEVDNGPEAAG